MRSKILYFLLIQIMALGTIYGQELHYSYYHFTPLNVNPANAGAFSGSYRISGIFSDKQAAFTSRPFTTLTLSADAPIIRGIRKQDWVGLGVEMDVIGNSGLFVGKENDPTPGEVSTGSTQKWAFMKIGAAYHLSLDKKQTNIITLGAQFINGSRDFKKLSEQDARVRQQTGFPDLDILNFNNGTQSGGNNTGNIDPFALPFNKYKDLSVGFLYNARRKNSDLRLGFAMEGLLNAGVGFRSKNTNKDSIETKYFGLNVHGSYDMAINKRTNIEPAFYYYSLGPAWALNVNTHAWYKVNPEKDFRGGVGLGLRNLRAAMIYIGAEFKDIRVGLAYDLTLSSATIADRSVGGFELAARYLGKIYKKPKPKPVIFCPRL
ncbi:MAG: type IX secretion system membrane protein PorP/SprF [Saprospiraceae bacterium]|nr:type IX secretion system membrane protein PorP/SprF [Saprospiraceae bacterium]MBK8668596.1 type IX secretion system membrane protein PorP/SprF [Saprospiraceae bacterium]